MWRFPAARSRAPCRGKQRHKCGLPFSSARRCWHGLAGRRPCCPAGAGSAPAPLTCTWRVWRGWGCRSWTPGRGGWCCWLPPVCMGQKSPCGSPVWGPPRRFCWRRPAPGAAPCCGELRGSRRSQTWPIFSTGAAAVWRGREAPRSSLRGGGRWAGACFRPCRTVFLPPRWPVRRPPLEAGWN